MRIFKIVIISLLLVATSCGESKKDKELKRLKFELEQTRKLKKKTTSDLRKLQSTRDKEKATKYIWTVISYSTTFEGDMIYYTEIEKIVNMNNTKKYQIQDNLVSYLKQMKDFSSNNFVIRKRETFIFNSYVEASKHMRKTLN